MSDYSDLQKTIIQIVGASGQIDIDTIVAAMADVSRVRAMGLADMGVLRYDRGTLTLSGEGEREFRAIKEAESCKSDR